MRLIKREQDIIVQAIHKIDHKAKVYLFGSRVDDNKKGGDIDLFILSDTMNYGDKLTVKRFMFDNMDEQKIDILLSRDSTDSFLQMIFDQGVMIS